jgi:hypothetical protein
VPQANDLQHPLEQAQQFPLQVLGEIVELFVKKNAG